MDYRYLRVKVNNPYAISPILLLPERLFTLVSGVLLLGLLSGVCDYTDNDLAKEIVCRKCVVVFLP